MHNKNILITGCSTGFGMETALYLAERGCRVFASMRDLSRRDDLDQAAASRKVNLQVLQLDITDRSSIDKAVQRILTESGGIDGVVNNAGTLIRGYFEDLTEAEIRQVFETNFYGTLAVISSVLPHMRTARRGRIIIISSVAGRIGAPAGSAYATSRFAQEGFAECLSQEVAPHGVKVILIEPGMTKTHRIAIDQGIAKGARNPNGPYYAWFTRANQIFDQALNTSPIHPIDVARTIHKALTVSRPRLRYVVGRRAGLVLFLRRYIPGELFERFYFGEVMRRVTKDSE